MLGQKTEHLNPATLIGYKDLRHYIAVKNFSLSPRPNLQADKVQPGHGGISLSGAASPDARCGENVGEAAKIYSAYTRRRTDTRRNMFGSIARGLQRFI